MLIKEAVIKSTGEYEMIVLSPQMISLLIEKTERSDTKELVVPAAEFLPRGYIEYLARVLSVNFETARPRTGVQAAYNLITGQIGGLKIDAQKCFDDVRFLEETPDGQFNLNANEKFYTLVKQKNATISYSYRGLDGKSIKIILIHPS